MAQSAHGTVAIASAVANGEEGDEPGPYNRDGTLAVWAHDRYHILPGHIVSASSPFQEFRYSTVVDVAFNPAFPERLISSGTDRTIAIWDCDSFEYGVDEPRGHIVHTACPMGILSFKPAEPLLAMAGRDGCVYLHSDKPNMPAVTDILRLAPRSGHEVADIAWGVNGSSHALFASSAPLAYGVYDGVHKVFDFEKSKTLCTFDTQAEGERIALDQAGERLAVAVRSSATAHALRMYDARRLARASVQSIDLQPFDGEVNAVAFGPGGIYIAIARSDNSAHVYDSRFLGREPMHVCKHREGNVISKDTSGVTEAVWTEGTSRGMGLVTGGVDGCIRLWDVRQAPSDASDDNVLVQCDDDIGSFVLGDHPDTPLIVARILAKSPFSTATLKQDMMLDIARDLSV
ncbi:WD40 repeat-like protein, partial [Wolfiporia cocos MD-104 SS10]